MFAYIYQSIYERVDCLKNVCFKRVLNENKSDWQSNINVNIIDYGIALNDELRVLCNEYYKKMRVPLYNFFIMVIVIELKICYYNNFSFSFTFHHKKNLAQIWHNLLGYEKRTYSCYP